MAVITRVYPTYAEARRAVEAVDNLGLAGVEAAVLGNESVQEFRNPPIAGMHGDVVHGGVAPDGTIREGVAYDGVTRDGVTHVTHKDEPSSTSGAATGAGVGAAIGGGAGLLAGLGMLAIPGLGPLVAAGWLASTAAGLAGGALAGGAVGALTDLGISDEEAPVFNEAMRRGNVAVSVRFEEEDRAHIERALGSAPAQDYTDLRETYEADGWRHDETEAEREARLARNAPPPPYL